MEAGCGGGGDAGVAEVWGVEGAAEERDAHCVIVSDSPSEAHAGLAVQAMAPAARFFWVRFLWSLTCGFLSDLARFPFPTPETWPPDLGRCDKL